MSKQYKYQGTQFEITPVDECTLEVKSERGSVGIISSMEGTPDTPYSYEIHIEGKLSTYGSSPEQARDSCCGLLLHREQFVPDKQTNCENLQKLYEDLPDS